MPSVVETTQEDSDAGAVGALPLFQYLDECLSVSYHRALGAKLRRWVFERPRVGEKELDTKGRFRRIVSWAFAAITVAALAVFEQAITAFVSKRGWDQVLNKGWAALADLGWADAVAFGFFFLGGATVALWTESALRDRREARSRLEQEGKVCTASFTFTRTDDDDIKVAFDGATSDNVAYWVWSLNNGGTRLTTSVILFVEFERPVSSPAVFVGATSAQSQQWREFATTDRFTFVELKGSPSGKITVQAFASKRLGLDRRSELMVWRDCSPA